MTSPIEIVMPSANSLEFFIRHKYNTIVNAPYVTNDDDDQVDDEWMYAVEIRSI